MFRIADPDQSYPCEVKVQAPGAEGPVTSTCTVHFRVLPGAEIDELAAESDAALLRRALVGWSDIEDADGSPLAFTEESRDRLVQIRYFSRAVVLAYFRWVMGLAEGNSGAPRAAS